MDYPWKYFAEFEKDGKLMRQKTWSPDWKAKARVIIHTEFFLFFNTGSCFTNGAVIHMI